ncbi:Type III restriction enzyme, res subunit, partial [Operophtera brumata]
MLLAVDFQLVRVRAELQGNIDKMLESREEEIRTVSPRHELDRRSTLSESATVLLPHHAKMNLNETKLAPAESLGLDLANESLDELYFAEEYSPQTSEQSLVLEERNKLARREAYKAVPKEIQFIVKTLYDLVDGLELLTPAEYVLNDFLDKFELPDSPPTRSLSSSSMFLRSDKIARQYGKADISMKQEEADIVAKELKKYLENKIYKQLVELPLTASTPDPSPPKKREHIAFESSMNLTAEMKQKLSRRLDTSEKKSNLKNIGVQTEKQIKDKKRRKELRISESETVFF